MTSPVDHMERQGHRPHHFNESRRTIVVLPELPDAPASTLQPPPERLQMQIIDNTCNSTNPLPTAGPLTFKGASSPNMGAKASASRHNRTPLPTPKLSRSAAIVAKCRDCNHNPESPGTWREQVAACVSASCALFDFRPVPRACILNGSINPSAIAAVRAKLDRTTRNADRR